MAKKFKDYYDPEAASLLGSKIKASYSLFDVDKFVTYITDRLDDKGFLERQDLFVEALELTLKPNYNENIQIFHEILGPELETTDGMFREGWWLWPIGRYVEKHGVTDFSTSMDFIYELTKRFTGEFAIRPLIKKYPQESLFIIKKWTRDSNVHVRRLSSEGLRIRLPWSKKLLIALEEFDAYKEILSLLKSDPERFVQKSVGNNLNDLMKEDPDKAYQIIKEWQKDKMSKETEWIIKHGMRSVKIK